MPSFIEQLSAAKKAVDDLGKQRKDHRAAQWAKHEQTMLLQEKQQERAAAPAAAVRPMSTQVYSMGVSWRLTNFTSRIPMPWS